MDLNNQKTYEKKEINKYATMDMNEEEAKFCLLKSLSIINQDEYLYLKVTELGGMYGVIDNELNRQRIEQLLFEIHTHIQKNYPFIDVKWVIE